MGLLAVAKAAADRKPPPDYEVRFADFDKSGKRKVYRYVRRDKSGNPVEYIGKSGNPVNVNDFSGTPHEFYLPHNVLLSAGPDVEAEFRKFLNKKVFDTSYTNKRNGKKVDGREFINKS